MFEDFDTEDHIEGIAYRVRPLGSNEPNVLFPAFKMSLAEINTLPFRLDPYIMTYTLVVKHSGQAPADTAANI